jgi:uncharacterized damage-inducible protein DinB
MDRQLIEKYAAGAGKVAQAIAGLSREDFLKQPVPGTWSIGQIVIHLMDSDLIASDRMKRVIAEENPAIIGYNEAAFAQKLYYEIKKNRDLTAVILRSLPDDAFARFGTHNEAGKKTLADFVKIYVDHLEHHLGFIRKKRELIGKPL